MRSSRQLWRLVTILAACRRSLTSPRIWIVMGFTPISRTMMTWGVIILRNWKSLRFPPTCRTTLIMKPTAGTLRWRKTAPSRIRAMCVIRVTVSMSITTVSAAVSPMSTGDDLSGRSSRRRKIRVGYGYRL